mgnify:CR=1 FL=1
MAVWHRRAGKDLFAINFMTCAAVQRVGLYWHLLPTYNQGRKIVWQGMTKDGRAFLDHIPESLISGKNDTDMRITFKNGSIYQVVGTDDPDRLVGPNPIGLVFSEYSLQDPKAWDLLRPILAENEGWALFIYTSRGHNHGYTMKKLALKNSGDNTADKYRWFYSELRAGNHGTKRDDGSPVISDEAIEAEREAGMAEEMIQQEFFCSFDAPLVGAYYGQQMIDADKQKRITNVPYDPQLEVDTAWDLGMDDTTTIWFFQEYGLELRLIDYYEASGEGLQHYAKILREKNYAYGRHLAPHDIMVRELGTGKSRLETARSLGIPFTVVTRHDVEDGINAVRMTIPMCWFDQERCSRGIEALRQYRKEFDEKTKCFSGKPLHDWSSNGSDAFRILAWGRRRRQKNIKRPEKAISDYNPFNY